MAHCAEIDNQGKVLRVIVVDENYGDLTCEEWCEKTYGGMWKKTSYNTHGGKHLLGGQPFRFNYAGIGYSYDFTKEAFIPPQPFMSWKLNKKTYIWEPPITRPDPEHEYQWDEEIKNWKKIT